VLDVGLLINLFAMLALGGVGSMAGPIVGSVIGVYLNDTLAAQQQYSQLIWGWIIIGVIIVAPGGVVGFLSQALRLVRDRVLAPLVAREEPAAATELNIQESATRPRGSTARTHE